MRLLLNLANPPSPPAHLAIFSLIDQFVIPAFCPSSELLHSAFWLEQARDLSANECSFLLQTVQEGKAVATRKAYFSCFKRFKQWCICRGCLPLPCSVAQLALFASSVLAKGNSYSSLLQHVSGIGFVHELAGLPSPAKAPLLQSILQAAKRKAAGPRRPKAHVSLDMLHVLVASSDLCSLADLRLLALILLSVSCFLRAEEALGLNCNDLSLPVGSETIGWVCVRRSKTDKSAQGTRVPFSFSGSLLCPVTAVRRYVAAGQLQLDASVPLFRALTRGMSGCQRLASRRLSYTRARELFRGLLTRAGFEPNRYGLHSLRSGGASLAANRGVSDASIRQHGRWSSESSKALYVRRSEAERAAVATVLSL